MKLYKTILAYGVIAALSLSVTGCDDDSRSDELAKEARILPTFKVKKEIFDEATGKTDVYVFNGVVDDEAGTVTIKIAPHFDIEKLLNGAFPVFYMPMGATASPDPGLPQNFAQEGGVKYTITSMDGSNSKTYTVSYGPSDFIPYGTGFSFAEMLADKTFALSVEQSETYVYPTEVLGYPGACRDWSQGDPKHYGDLNAYISYCGGKIVVLSRNYIEAGDEEYGIRIYDEYLNLQNDKLNLGAFTANDLKMVATDWYGHMVGIVTIGDDSEIFYWNSPAEAPVSVGKPGLNLTPIPDGANNFQVAGDITGTANLTALAKRSTTGDHNLVRIEGGKIVRKSIISSGYSSADCSLFQMICCIDDSENPAYLVGDTEGSTNAANGIHCYVNTPSGMTTSIMPGLWQSTLQKWWVGTGFSTSRGGGRRPVVMSLPINGKDYAFVMSGSGWWHGAAVLSPDLQMLSNEVLNITMPTNAAWSFGGWADWYWDEETHTAHLAVWGGRYGIKTYRMTCYE